MRHNISRRSNSLRPGSNVGQFMLLKELEQFTGCDELHPHSVNSHVSFTEGIKFLIEEVGAGWLVDAITSHLTSKKFEKLLRRNDCLYFHSWHLIVNENRSAILTGVGDCDKPPFIKQKLSLTDFPLPKIDIWAGCVWDNWNLWLESEC